MKSVKEYNIPVINGEEFKGKFRSLKTFEDIDCTVKVIAKRIWITENNTGAYNIVKALDGPEKDELYCSGYNYR